MRARPRSLRLRRPNRRAGNPGLIEKLGGHELRPLRENYIDTRLGSTITFGGAAGLRFADKKILIGPEVFGRTIVSNADGAGRHDTPIEILMGFHFNVARGFRSGGGASAA